MIKLCGVRTKLRCKLFAQNIELSVGEEVNIELRHKLSLVEVECLRSPPVSTGASCGVLRRHCISQIAAAAADTQHSFMVKNSDLLRVAAK